LGFAGDARFRFRLGSDIDLSAAPGFYVSYLAAEFDGDNHTLSNLSIDLPFAGMVGMFGYIGGGTVRNIRC